MQAAQAKRELIKLQQSGDLAQIAGQLEVNKAEAASPSPFTSGWRPFIGWTCGAGFAVQFVVGPVGEWVCALAGHPVKFPPHTQCRARWQSLVLTPQLGGT